MTYIIRDKDVRHHGWRRTSFFLIAGKEDVCFFCCGNMLTFAMTNHNLSVSSALSVSPGEKSWGKIH